MNCGLVCQ